MIRAWLSFFIIGLSLFAFACFRPSGFGKGGRYIDARLEIIKPRGNLTKAITKLEGIVREDPFYRDSLTLLGRAYYGKRRYRDAFEVLKRALAVNPKDEIAWITLGLAQLNIGDDKRGLESLKTGLSLLSRVSKDGYRGLESWDKNGLVRSALRRSIFLVVKGGLKGKRKIIRMGEVLLRRIDDEVWDVDREELLKLHEE